MKRKEPIALLILLPIFGLVTGAVLIASVEPLQGLGETGEPPATPADFPEVFAQNPLEGLDTAEGEHVAVPPPPFRDPQIFPCNDCHEGDPGDPRRRELTEHTDIVLHHDEEHRWCLDCHLGEDRDFLHLAGGAKVPFAESYRLCGQCHGTQYRDWRAGVHGRRSGYWNGPKRYLLCVHCHDPHGPRFRPIAPLPPPVPPHELRPLGEDRP